MALRNFDKFRDKNVPGSLDEAGKAHMGSIRRDAMATCTACTTAWAVRGSCHPKHPQEVTRVREQYNKRAKKGGHLHDGSRKAIVLSGCEAGCEALRLQWILNAKRLLFEGLRVQLLGLDAIWQRKVRVFLTSILGGVCLRSRVWFPR